MNLKQENPELFNAVNILKANSFVYGRGAERKVYETLLTFRNDVDDILSYDNCCMRANTELEVIKIHFLDEGEEPAENRLKARFTANMMKVYAACLTLYNEKFAALGTYVNITVGDVMDCLDALKLSVGIGKRKGSSSKGEVTNALEKLDRFGIIAFHKQDGYMILKPGITMGLDRETFMKTCGELMETWTGLEESNAEEGEGDEQDA